MSNVIEQLKASLAEILPDAGLVLEAPHAGNQSSWVLVVRGPNRSASLEWSPRFPGGVVLDGHLRWPVADARGLAEEIAARTGLELAGPSLAGGTPPKPESLAGVTPPRPPRDAPPREAGDTPPESAAVSDSEEEQ